MIKYFYKPITLDIDEKDLNFPISSKAVVLIPDVEVPLLYFILIFISFIITLYSYNLLFGIFISINFLTKGGNSKHSSFVFLNKCLPIIPI